MNKLSKIIAASLICASFNVFAGDCPALSGKYIIGKVSGADFSTINDATNALKCGGVSGPVTFRIEKGIYNEKIVLSGISGASAFNTVNFVSASGNNTDVIISFPGSEATLSLNAVSYVAFENISVDHKAATYGNSLRIDGKSDNIHFKSVIFDGVESARTGNNNAVVYFTATEPKANVFFEDCEINNGSTGLYKSGVSADSKDSKTSITGTLFFNQYENGLVLNNEDAPVISNNVVSSLSNYNQFKAINLDNVSHNVIISNNIINAVSASVGLAMNNCLAEVTNMGQINNNSIAVGGKEQAYDIYLTGSTDNQVFNFNRVKLTTDGKENATQAYYKNVGSGSNINMMNNICYDMKNGGYTIIGNSYKDFFNQLPAQSNPTLSVSANGLMVEKVTTIK